MSNNRPLAASSSSTANDLDFLAFLRTAGGTVPTDASDRRNKRPHAGSVTGREAPQTHPVRSGSTSSTTSRAPLPSRENAGSTPDTAISLLFSPPTMPPPPPAPPRPSSSHSSSSLLLPPWQPDATVHACPVCNTDFTFWFRKHHCRKCGRVVCAACSPHRITMPRAYIVQPPGFAEAERMARELLGEAEREPWEDVGGVGAGRGSGLGGGEVVRVCRPCIPDPWRPTEEQAAAALARNSPTALPADRPHPPASQPLHPPSPPIPLPPSAPPRYRFTASPLLPTPPPSFIPARTRSISHHAFPGSSYVRPNTTPSNPSSVSTSYPRPANRPVPGHRPTQSHSAAIIPSSSVPRRMAPPPRRDVREEDECPVCGHELPPSTNIALRETHIEECIAGRFSSGTPPPGTPPARARAQSYRPRGMALSIATEKDCVSAENGEPVECVICLEEFQPGEELGRMECLCKFHRACIKGWWERRGRGGCPTHVMYDA